MKNDQHFAGGELSSALSPSFLPVRGEDDAPALSHDGGDGVPEEASGGGVHSRGGFVQEQDGRVAHKCYGRAQLPLVAATGQHSTFYQQPFIPFYHRPS